MKLVDSEVCQITCREIGLYLQTDPSLLTIQAKRNSTSRQVSEGSEGANQAFMRLILVRESTTTKVRTNMTRRSIIITIIIMRKLQSLKLQLYQYPRSTVLEKPTPSLSHRYHTTKQSYKKILAPRMSRQTTSYKMFNAFNYQNYQIVKTSKELSPKHKNVIILGKDKEKYESDLHKNIELVYCKNKIDNFQEILSSRVQTAFSANLRRSRSITLNKRLSTQKAKEPSSSSTTQPYRLNKGKSSLITLMKEFSDLQKKSVFMNPEQKQMHIKLNAMKRKYIFLESLDGFTLSRLFKAIGAQQKQGKWLIELKTFIVFCKLLTVRDASKTEIATFLEGFLFGQGQKTFAETQNVLKRLGGSAKIHKKIEHSLFQFFNSKQKDFRGWCEKNQKFTLLIIDLILLQKD